MAQTVALGKRVLRGVLGGLLVATLLSALATFGRVSMGAAAYERANGPWVPTLLIYFAILPLMGALVGVLFPLYRFAWGAILLGFIVVFPLVFAFGLLGHMEGMPFGARVVVQIIVSLIMGGGIGLQRWSVDRQKGKFRDQEADLSTE